MTCELDILAISGSLRAASSNTALLQAAAAVAPAGVVIRLYDGVGALPHYNPDLDGEAPPPIVQALRERVGRAHGLLISSPEYAHGVPGSLKNALDWLVRSLEFPDKPVALLCPNNTGRHARAALFEILRTMSATVVEEASISLPLSTNRIDAAGFSARSELATPLRAAVEAFVRAIATTRRE